MFVLLKTNYKCLRVLILLLMSLFVLFKIAQNQLKIKFHLCMLSTKKCFYEGWVNATLATKIIQAFQNKLMKWLQIQHFYFFFLLLKIRQAKQRTTKIRQSTSNYCQRESPQYKKSLQFLERIVDNHRNEHYLLFY